MKILAFDPGISPGWALLDDTGTETMESGHISNDSEIPISPRLSLVRQFIRNKISAAKPDLIAVEAVNRFFGGAKNAHSFALYYIFGEVLVAAYELGYPVITISPTTVKSRFAGDHKAKKPDMCRAASEYMNKPINNDNEADAIGIAKTAKQLYLEYLDPNKKAKPAKPKRKSTSATNKRTRSRGADPEFEILA